MISHGVRRTGNHADDMGQHSPKTTPRSWQQTENQDYRDLFSSLLDQIAFEGVRNLLFSDCYDLLSSKNRFPFFDNSRR